MRTPAPNPNLGRQFNHPDRQVDYTDFKVGQGITDRRYIDGHRVVVGADGREYRTREDALKANHWR